MSDLEVVWSGAHSRQGLLLSGDWPPQRESHYDRFDDGGRIPWTDPRPHRARQRTCPHCHTTFAPRATKQTYCSAACARHRPHSLEFRASLHPCRRGHCCACGCHGWMTTSRRYLPGHRLLAAQRQSGMDSAR